MRTLVIGAGEVGGKHLDALAATPGFKTVGIADPAVPACGQLPVFADYRAALAKLRPDFVVVATPPGQALSAARDAAVTGARVLVEKPATLRAADLDPRPGDERIHVAFQPHFAPGLPGLIASPPTIERAVVTLTCHRDEHYYRGWRASHISAGGILHQQAIHGLALVLRLAGEPAVKRCTARTLWSRGFGDVEDRVAATVSFANGLTVDIEGRVDSDREPRHEVTLHTTGGQPRRIRGRNLEAGLGPAMTAPTHQNLRRRMYQAIRRMDAGGPEHPSLYPLRLLRFPIKVINQVYASARQVSEGDYNLGSVTHA